jgi:hypothetical protein
MSEAAILDLPAPDVDESILDLTAEDVDESTWDELVREMVGESSPYEVNINMSSPACSYCSSNCSPCNTALD